MDPVALEFFPLPHMFRGQRKNGVRLEWPERCSKCDRQCESNHTQKVELCSYGVNYVWLSDELMVAGVIAKDFGQSTPAREKMLRRGAANMVTLRELDELQERVNQAASLVATEIEREKAKILSNYRETEGYKHDLVELLRPQIEQELGQVHDYRQFVGQIIQNMNVIWEKRLPGRPIETHLQRASHEEVAIYWAARLMLSKLEAALFLMYPERIRDPHRVTRFSLHGAVTKYCRIYQRSFDQKEVRLHLRGFSAGKVESNADAVGVVVHTLLDNALKYAPTESRVEVWIEEDASDVRLGVESLGPRVERSESEKIFELFYRGSVAAQLDTEGTGFGLGAAQNVAENLGTQVEFSQEPVPVEGNMHKTRFSIAFPRAS